MVHFYTLLNIFFLPPVSSSFLHMYINKYGFSFVYEYIVDSVHASRLYVVLYTINMSFVTKSFFLLITSLCVCMFCVPLFRFPRLPLSVCQVPFFFLWYKYSLFHYTLVLPYYIYIYAQQGFIRRGWGMWYFEEKRERYVRKMFKR